MSIDAKTVKELRDRTGAGMMDCKRALTKTDGDLDKAVSHLREQGLASAAKKAGRVAAEGTVAVFASDDDATAVVVELNCETDFVAKTEQFQALVDDIGDALLQGAKPGEGSGESVAGLTVGGTSLSDLMTESIASIGENLSLRRFTRIAADGAAVGTYLHAGGKIGVIVETTEGGNGEAVRSVAMQVAAAMPRYVSRDEVPAEEVDREREIYKNQALASGKPEQVVDKIVDGKLEKFYREVCLLEQDYIREPDLSVRQMLERDGGGVTVRSFTRYQLGEGIERASSNLADEVAEQIAQQSS
ncbi:MAG: translation elongation factor Ts [Deltaproteobacteria bacterium]